MRAWTGPAVTCQVLIAGDESAASGSLSAALLELCPVLTVRVTQVPDATPARMLILMPGEPDRAIAMATSFASAAGLVCDRLVLFIIAPAAKRHWRSARDEAALAAFTRHAALSWAPRDVRVNGIVADGAGMMPDELALEVARLCLAILRWHSMTGQMLCLGGQ